MGEYSEAEGIPAMYLSIEAKQAHNFATSACKYPTSGGEEPTSGDDRPTSGDDHPKGIKSPHSSHTERENLPFSRAANSPF